MKKVLLCVLTGMFICAMVGCSDPLETDTKGDNKSDSSTIEGEPVILTALMNSNDGFVRNFNIHTTGAYEFITGFMHEPLVIFDAINNNRETMWLAEDIISEPDNKTLTIKIRRGILWSDGEEFNADDVAFSFTYSSKYPEIDRTGDWGKNGKITEVNIIDDYTVQVVMKEENRFHRNTVFTQKWMIPEHIYSKITNPASYVMEIPVVTGAFSVVKVFTPEMVVLGRNPTYWKADDLEVDELRIPQYNGNDGALTLLQTGSIDWCYIFLPNIDTTYIQGDEYRKYWYGMNDAVRLSPNYMTKNEGNKKAFNNVEFKRALSLSIDREGIIDSAVYGYLDPILPTNTGLPPSLFAYRDEQAYKTMKDYAQYDIERAKKILSDSGFKDIDGDGFVENPDGSKIEFEILAPAGWTDWNDGATICAEGMRAIGVNAFARAVDLSLIIESWESGNHDMLYSAYGNISDIYRFYFDTIGDQSRVLTPTWWSITQTNYVNDTMTDLISQLPSATEDEVKEITAQIERHFADNMINIPILYNGAWNIYNDRRFTGWATAENPFVNPALPVHDTKILQLLALEPVQ